MLRCDDGMVQLELVASVWIVIIFESAEAHELNIKGSTLLITILLFIRTGWISGFEVMRDALIHALAMEVRKLAVCHSTTQMTFADIYATFNLHCLRVLGLR